MPTEIVGPFLEQWIPTLNGYRVPFVTARVSDNGVDICVDGRFMMPGPVSREEFDRWLPMLAHAMAIAGGYSCHGENCKPLNPFAVRMMGISPPGPNLTVVPSP